MLPEYHEAMLLSPDLHLTNSRVALVASLVETAYQLRTILGLNPEITKIKTQRIAFPPVAFKTENFRTDRFNVAAFQLHCLDEMCGFKVIMELLTYKAG